MGFDEFLREVTPYLGLQWRPFQRRGVKRKVERRVLQIGLPNFEQYLFRVREDSIERDQLSKILTVTITRFFRDKEVFQTIGNVILPDLLRTQNRQVLRVWCIGCASGEEPYSLSILWKKKFEKDFPSICLSILATDIDEALLERAKEGRYKKSSLKEGDEDVIQKFFKIDQEFYILSRTIQEGVEFKRHDVLSEEPFVEMDLVFCRNLAFTYFSKESQIRVLKKIVISLREKGYLVIGKEESLPLTYPTLFVPTFLTGRIYQKFHPSDVN